MLLTPTLICTSFQTLHPIPLPYQNFIILPDVPYIALCKLPPIWILSCYKQEAYFLLSKNMKKRYLTMHLSIDYLFQNGNSLNYPGKYAQNLWIVRKVFLRLRITWQINTSHIHGTFKIWMYHSNPDYIRFVHWLQKWNMIIYLCMIYT